MSLESVLREKRDLGRKLLVAYVTAGISADWLDFVQGCVDGGADAVEIGLPFSDPIMDGPIIAGASQTALERGVTAEGILDELSTRSFTAPLIAMTYFNVLYHPGIDVSLGRLQKAGVQAVIIPDLPFDESNSWRESAHSRGIETVLLAAPSTPDDRLNSIAQDSEGFIYAVGLMGVTGERENLASSAQTIATRLKKITDKPVLIGVGVSNPEQAREACQVADGVVVGSAIVRRMLTGEPPSQVGNFVSSLRTGIDE